MNEAQKKIVELKSLLGIIHRENLVARLEEIYALADDSRPDEPDYTKERGETPLIETAEQFISDLRGIHIPGKDHSFIPNLTATISSLIQTVKARDTQRSIYHVTMAGDPSDEELQKIAELVRSAEKDPIGAIIATRDDVHIQKLEPDAEFRFETVNTSAPQSVFSFSNNPNNFHITIGPVTIDRLGTISIDGEEPADENAKKFLWALAHWIGTMPFVYDHTIKYVASDQHRPLAGAPHHMTYETAKGTQENLLKLFRFRHLDSPLGKLSQIFASLACWIVDTQPASPERTLTLRALWDTKNLAVINIVPDGEG